MAFARSLLAQSGVIRIDENPSHGILRSGSSLERDALDRGCPAFVRQGRIQRGALQFEATEDAALFELPCQRESTVPLPDADGAHWIAVKYERRFVFATDSASTSLRRLRDTMTLRIAVLYAAARHNTRWRAEWIGTVEERLTADGNVSA
jgi:hypothetical protein